MSNVITVNKENFDEQVLQSEIPVLVDFWAEWCGPCKMIAPSVSEIADDFTGKCVVAKIDVDENPEISATYGIRGIPALLFFRDGKPVDQVVGAVSKTVLVQHLNKVIDSD